MLSIFYILMKKKYVLLAFQKLIWVVKNEKQMILLMIPSEEKEGWHYVAVKKISALLHRVT